MSNQLKYPHSYRCTRKIRKEFREVLVTRLSRTSETIQLLHHKPRQKQHRTLTRAEARKFHNKRTIRAKRMDGKQDNSQIVKDTRFIRDPSHFDFPNVDTKGRGIASGEGRKAGRKLRHK